jgi:hypothetical protein
LSFWTTSSFPTVKPTFIRDHTRIDTFIERHKIMNVVGPIHRVANFIMLALLLAVSTSAAQAPGLA